MPTKGAGDAVKIADSPPVPPFVEAKSAQMTGLIGLFWLIGMNLGEFRPFSGRWMVNTAWVGSTTLPLDIDIPEVAGYHYTAKSGWTSWSLNCEFFLFLPPIPPALFFYSLVTCDS